MNGDTSTIVKQFGSGQITIPKKWRNETTTAYRAKRCGRDIILSPVEPEEHVIFDAERDNDGEPVPVQDFVKILKKR